MRLDRIATERLVLAAARDHFYAADALDSPGVAAAQRCLALLPDSPAVRAEGDAIAALLRLHREHSYAMLPAAFKQVLVRVQPFMRVAPKDSLHAVLYISGSTFCQAIVQELV